MNKNKPILSVFTFFILFLFTQCSEPKIKKTDFISIKNGNFMLNNKRYTFIGTNYWQGMNLGAPESGNRERLIRELDKLQSLGIKNLRILGASEADSSSKYCIHPALQTKPGVYNNDLWLGLDFLLDEMRKRNMKAVVILNNFWSWSGGFSQYVKWAQGDTIPYPQESPYSWSAFSTYSKQFLTNEKCLKWYENHLHKIINRVNTINNTPYKEDPTIMSWQLANEARGYDLKKEFQDWIYKSSSLIKKLDPNHLISFGSEGNTPYKSEGLNAEIDNNYPNIDYITMHIWVQNWRWFDINSNDSAYQTLLTKVDKYWSEHEKIAQKLNKPIVLEEFGIGRDGGSYSDTAKTKLRNKYYNYIFTKVRNSIKLNNPVKGINFWAYSGEGKARKAGEYWKKGDDFIGDPPHELQGWYGVPNSDSSTLKLIKDFGLEINTTLRCFYFK